MIADRAWVLLPSGRRLDLLRPDPAAWTDRDLAIGLSRTYRWGGHSRWDLPLSVAQHSLLVLVLRQRMQALRPLAPGEALRELLHDAQESFFCWDPVSPLKPHLGPDFQALVDRQCAAIDARYQLVARDADDYIQHKKADRLAAASEAFHVTGWSRQEIRDSLLITIDPVDEDPLPVPDGMRPWEPWPPRLAAALFLAKLQELIKADHARDEPPGDLHAAVARERTISTLAASFSRLPVARRRKCTVALTGNSLSDTFVLAEADDGSQSVEGVVVDGRRDETGAWDFETDFTLFTTDEELIVCHGYNCHVEIQ